MPAHEIEQDEPRGGPEGDAPRRSPSARPPRGGSRAARRDRTRGATLFRAVALAFVVLGLFGVSPALQHARSAALLGRFASGATQTDGLAFAEGVDEAPLTIATPTGPTRARLYLPREHVRAPGLVLIPGVHHLGVDEPRLQRFARAIASSGIAVLTPEIQELTEYRVEPRSIGTIGAAARDLAARLHRRRVGVMGMSFAGGLALLAAADPDPSSAIGFVVAVGAHDDLARVGRFFATDVIPEPNGPPLHLRAHDYGMLVLVRAHVEDFFEPRDRDAAREVIKLWLWEDRDAAHARESALSPTGRAKMDRLLAGRDAEIAAEVLTSVDRHGPEMAAVSPHGHLGQLHVPVFLLHGAGDTVIPPAETDWLATEVPRPWLENALVSPAIQHVELHGEPTVGQKWALVHFMAQVLAACDDDEPKTDP